MVQTLKQLAVDESGAVILELSVVFPVLLILGFGAIEFAGAFFAHQTVTQQVREASRFLARTATPLTTETAFRLATSKHPDPDLACPPGGNSDTCIFPWFSPSDLSAAVVAIENPEDANGFRLYRGGVSIPVITVTATVTYPGADLLPAIGVDGVVQFTVTHSERVVGH
jgi:hypothetical protein